MTNFFFTADTHFFHERICEYSSRPFGSLEEMHDALISNWNSVVRRGDLVYHLGDFMLSWGGDTDRANSLIKSLNGSIHLILGNHDRKDAYSANFAWVGPYKRVKVNGQTIVLFHYPIRSWHGIHRGAWHLHGHSHGNLEDVGGKVLDVGVDCWNYTPASFDVIRDEMGNRESVYVDHHREDT